MRKYSIKRGHNPDLKGIVKEYFDVDGDFDKGVVFETEGIGTVNLKKEGNAIIINIIPPENPIGNYDILRKWNDFLFDVTGRTAKERKKIMDREVKKSIPK